MLPRLMMIRRLSVIVILFLAGCQGPIKPPPKLKLTPVSFDDLPDWNHDDHRLALKDFKKSCLALEKKPVGQKLKLGTTSQDWHQACYALTKVDGTNKAAARQFFEQNFKVYKATDNGNANGLFTGYYESSLKGSRTKNRHYHYPIHKKPKDLVPHPKMKFGRKGIFGIQPHYSREEIHQGKLDGLGLEIVYVNSEVDAFFLHVQGSGRVTLDDGTALRVGYDGANGHPYTSIGKLLIDRGEIPKEYMSMQALRHWMKKHPHKARKLMEENASYVFFRLLEGDGPIGAQGIAVTTGRTLAVDKRFYELGMPMYLDAAFEGNQVNLRRLLIAQDTGGAIKGAVRGDVFWGYSDFAAQIAGTMKSKGQLYVMVPKNAQVPRQVILS